MNLFRRRKVVKVRASTKNKQKSRAKKSRKNLKSAVKMKVQKPKSVVVHQKRTQKRVKTAKKRSNKPNKKILLAKSKNIEMGCPSCTRLMEPFLDGYGCKRCQIALGIKGPVLDPKGILKKNKAQKLDLSSLRKDLATKSEKTVPTEVKKKKVSSSFDISSIKAGIEEQIQGKRGFKKQILLKGEKPSKRSKKDQERFMYTGIEGFDALLEKGIPKGAAVLVAGGAGSGKTIMTLQSLNYHAEQGHKCLYMSFEESEERLIRHMEEFGWDPKKLIRKKKLLVKRFNPFEVTRSVDALLMKSKGELLIDVKPIIFPKNFKPDLIVVDSLTAIASAFTDKEDSYRIYIEQLFRFFEEIGATSYLITETEQVPKIFSTTGVEEFLADAVVVLYNIRRGNVRERAIEILKLRGAGHKKQLVALNITSDGIEIFPDQEIFGGIENTV